MHHKAITIAKLVDVFYTPECNHSYVLSLSISMLWAETEIQYGGLDQCVAVHGEWYVYGGSLVCQCLISTLRYRSSIYPYIEDSVR